MKVNRRGLMHLFAKAPIVGVLASSKAVNTDSVMSNAAGKIEWRTMELGNAPTSALSAVNSSDNLDTAKLQMFLKTFGFPAKLEDYLLYQARSDFTAHIDPDIESFKSFSKTGKINLQVKRKVKRLKENLLATGYEHDYRHDRREIAFNYIRDKILGVLK